MRWSNLQYDYFATLVWKYVRWALQTLQQMKPGEHYFLQCLNGKVDPKRDTKTSVNKQNIQVMSQLSSIYCISRFSVVYGSTLIFKQNDRFGQQDWNASFTAVKTGSFFSLFLSFKDNLQHCILLIVVLDNRWHWNVIPCHEIHINSIQEKKLQNWYKT